MNTIFKALLSCVVNFSQYVKSRDIFKFIIESLNAHLCGLLFIHILANIFKEKKTERTRVQPDTDYRIKKFIVCI